MKTLNNIVEGDMMYGVDFAYIHSFIVPTLYILKIIKINWDNDHIPNQLITSSGVLEITKEMGQSTEMLNDVFTLDYGIFIKTYKECFNDAMKNVKRITKSNLRVNAIKQLWEVHNKIKKALTLNEELVLQCHIDIRYQRNKK